MEALDKQMDNCCKWKLMSVYEVSSKNIEAEEVFKKDRNQQSRKFQFVKDIFKNTTVKLHTILKGASIKRKLTGISVMNAQGITLKKLFISILVNAASIMVLFAHTVCMCVCASFNNPLWAVGKGLLNSASI